MSANRWSCETFLRHSKEARKREPCSAMHSSCACLSRCKHSVRAVELTDVRLFMCSQIKTALNMIGYDGLMLPSKYTRACAETRLRRGPLHTAKNSTSLRRGTEIIRDCKEPKDQRLPLQNRQEPLPSSPEILNEMELFVFEAQRISPRAAVQICRREPCRPHHVHQIRIEHTRHHRPCEEEVPVCGQHALLATFRALRVATRSTFPCIK
mmetsp:Transcript_22649/g.37424  ORF Transcript_22649/g.37424 Transcript_22649/m.37424 type:complete len:210 (+) Transcript_22649:91-720(+)